jgi:hypothetical protein
MISVTAGFIPTRGGSRNRNRGVAASLISGVSRWQSLGDVVRNGGVAASLVRGISRRQRLCEVFSRVDCRFMRWRDWTVGRGAAGRDGFVAGRCLCGRGCAVFAGVVDYAGDDRAW